MTYFFIILISASVGIAIGATIVIIASKEYDAQEYGKGYKDGCNDSRFAKEMEYRNMKILMVNVMKTAGSSIADDIACRHCPRRINGECPMEAKEEYWKCPMEINETLELYIRYGLEEIRENEAKYHKH